METTLLASRTRQFRLPVFLEIAALAQSRNAINLAGGVPDFPTPDAIKHAAIAAIEADFNQYALSHGVCELREGIAARLAKDIGIAFDPEKELTICCGSTEAMTAALLSIVNPGEEVIILEPAFTIYAPGVILSGGTPVPVKLDPPSFRIDPARLEAAISPRTKAIIINSPHNPTGRILTEEELSAVADLCLKYNLLALTDEIYDHIIFDGASLPRLWTRPGMRDRTLIINGFSKTYSITGWRIGYVVSPPDFTLAIRTVHNYLTLSAPAPLQIAAVTAARLPEIFYRQLADLYQQKRDLLFSGLQAVGFECLLPQGGYFILAGFKRFSKQKDVIFAKELIETVGVAATPVSGFYSNPADDDCHYLRFAFCKKEETLLQALDQLQQLRKGP